MGQIQTQVLTDSSGDDAKTGIKIIKKTKGKLASVTGDAAYDTLAIYGQAGSRGAKVVVPPTRSASVSKRGPRSAERDRTIKRVNRGWGGGCCPLISLGKGLLVLQLKLCTNGLA